MVFTQTYYPRTIWNYTVWDYDPSWYISHTSPKKPKGWQPLPHQLRAIWQDRERKNVHQMHNHTTDHGRTPAVAPKHNGAGRRMPIYSPSGKRKRWFSR